MLTMLSRVDVSSYSELFVESRQFYNLSHLRLAPPLGVFCRDFRHKKTSVTMLSCGVVCVILRLAVSVEHRLVNRRADGQTDRHTTTANTAIASVARVKTACFIARTLIWHPCSKSNRRSVWRMATIGQNVLETKNRPTSISRKPNEIELRLGLLLNANRKS